MSTFMANKGNIERKWYILDAANKPLGKTAAAAATLLRGKHKPEFTPNADCGDFVIVINADQAVLTGKKLDQKYYRRHSGWVGGLKEVKYRTLMSERPELAMKLAVKGMLPKNSLSNSALTRLKIYRGGEHEHAARSPSSGTLSNQEVDDHVSEQEALFLWHRPSEVLRGPCSPVPQRHRLHHHQRP